MEEFSCKLEKGDVNDKNKYSSRKNYTRLEEEETLTRCGTVFFVNPQEFGAKLPWFWDC